MNVPCELYAVRVSACVTEMPSVPNHGNSFPLSLHFFRHKNDTPIQWPVGLGRGSATAGVVGMWVRI